MTGERLGRGAGDSQENPRKKERGGGMLVLTRKTDQGIVIAGNIYVRVLGIERDRVKIGISAPLEIPVLRQELLEREQQELLEREQKAKDGSPQNQVNGTPKPESTP